MLFFEIHLVALVSCLRPSFIQRDSLTLTSYEEANINTNVWANTVSSVLENGCSAKVEDSISSDIEIREFYDKEVKRGFCLIVERAEQYSRGYGIFAVPIGASGPGVHIMAPHPIFDGDTTTDPTHNDKEPFSKAAKSIFDYNQSFPSLFCNNRTANLTSVSCGYVQFHGKISCERDTVFISTGYARSNHSNYQIYGSGAPSENEWFFTRFNQIANKTKPENWNITTPGTSSSCMLSGSSNIFGRLVNGVAPDMVCSEAADVSQASGQFVHIEQSEPARISRAYPFWINVFQSVIL
ncbi:hypothetical protein HK096_006608 [Nowakowskiella sp. JEL0078]|nr:hypothetical protein HK096_006608 [Nowakowskiella sp. JEL0078]